jgi:HEAT repeat protein
MALGSSCVPKLMDMYALQDFPASERTLAGLLMHFREAAVEEAQGRLADPRVHVVRNLLAFIQSNGDRSCIPSIRPLLQHKSHHVRSDALSVLLSYRDEGALEPLRTALRSKIREESSHAVALTGLYRVEELVDDLLKLIKLHVFRKTDHKRNEEIVRALGRIGDAKALPVLQKLARKSWVLYPSDFLQMKLALFESLGGYPREHLTALLSIGSRAKDFRIRNLCSTLQRGN